MLNARGVTAPPQSSTPTLLFTNYECCKTEHNDRDRTRPIFAALTTVSLMRLLSTPFPSRRSLGMLRRSILDGNGFRVIDDRGAN